MKAEAVLTIVLREMTAIGIGWRLNWSDFDGRTLRNQLDSLSSWAEGALKSNEVSDYTAGTEFLKETES